MKTTLHTDITVEQICRGFVYDESEDKGLFGMDGKLTIQPAYQRNRIYAGEHREEAVIDSLLKGYPIGLIYFNAATEHDVKRFEVLDGRQRLTSIGRFVTLKFAVRDENGMEQLFDGLPENKREKILKTPLPICECEGEESEIMDWFRTLTPSGIPPKTQEIRNSVYTGPFVTAAKAYFSNSGNSNLRKWSTFIDGEASRQDYLERALEWVSAAQGMTADRYMSLHRRDRNIAELKNYFNSVIDWADGLFATVYKEMRELEWGRLYEAFHDMRYDLFALDREIGNLYADHCVTDRRGIWEYVLGGCVDKSLLKIRVFDPVITRYIYNQQTLEAKGKGVSNCPLCASGVESNRSRIWKFEEMDADHVTPWSKGGVSDLGSCQVLCGPHNRARGNR